MAAAGRNNGTADDRYHALLARSGTELFELFQMLAECDQGLARVVHARGERAWSDYEHDAYLRLRTTRARLEVKLRQAERRFERARGAVRDAEAANRRTARA